MTEFKMPSLGADMEAGTLRSWRIKPGDTVKAGDIIAEVETQKGIIEIEIFTSGVIEKLLLQINEPVPVGKVMALLKEAETITPQPTPAPIGIPVETVTLIQTGEHLSASPLARKIAASRNITLKDIKGTGPGGAIVREDVEHMIGKPEANVEPAANVGQSIRQAVATAMSRSNREIPHYYLTQTIEVSAVLARLERMNAEQIGRAHV